MDIPYRHAEKIKLNQHTKTLSSATALPALLLVVPESPDRACWEALPHAQILKPRWQRMQRRDKQQDCLVTDLPGSAGTRVWLLAVKADGSAFEILTRAREISTDIFRFNPGRLALQVSGFAPATGRKVLEQLVAALLAGSCPMPDYRKEPAAVRALARIDCYGLDSHINTRALQAEACGNHLARWLSALPPNDLSPASYQRFVATLARQHGWRMRFHNRKALEKVGAGAFLAVCRGSPAQDAGIVQLSYRPSGKGRPVLALVGKGICFDTGGVNLKTAKHMNGMHEDMQGSAVALGSLLALTLSGSDQPVDCWLALAENHIGSRAYRPNEVVRACNGLSIEVKHTDAEGRMILADTLALASRAAPAVMIDYATLTGTCIYALSERYSGVFSNREALHGTLIKAGRTCGERVWPFPMDPDFDEALQSNIADTLQCTLESEADHILAARFLSRFVDPAIHWIHVDLAASNRKGGLAHIPTDTTGFGVRLTMQLLSENLMEGTWN